MPRSQFARRTLTDQDTIRNRLRRIGRAALGCTVASMTVMAHSPARAISAGTRDTFQSGTTENWVEGLGIGVPPVPPTVFPNIGPNGTGDFALRVTGTGTITAGGKLVVNNIQPRWTGNYTAAGIGWIVFDVRNLNTVPLTLRVGIDGPALGPTGGRWITPGLTVPAQSGWKTLFFPFTAQSLVAGDLAATNVSTTLSNVAVIRIMHAPTAAWTGEPIAGQMELNDIEALPEPGIGTPLVAGIAGLMALGRTRRR